MSVHHSFSHRNYMYKQNHAFVGIVRKKDVRNKYLFSYLLSLVRMWLTLLWTSASRDCSMVWQRNSWCCLNTLFIYLIIATCSSQQSQNQQIPDSPCKQLHLRSQTYM